MQYVDGFIELRDVHHTINSARVPDSNLSCTGAHIVERLPVGRLKPGLDLPQRICFSSSIQSPCINSYTRYGCKSRCSMNDARFTSISRASIHSAKVG